MMNKTLIDSFKEHCDRKIKILIDSCCISICEENRLYRKTANSIIVCEIYSPFALCQELIDSKQELIEAANLVGIGIIDIIPLDPRHLAILKHKAMETNDPKLWRKYLNFLYLF